MLNQVTLACYEQGSPNQFINSQTWCICELYGSFLKGYDTNGIVKCNIDIKDKRNNLVDYYERYRDVITITVHFDFEHYLNLSRFEIKREQLNTLHKGMMLIAQKEGWTTNELLDAYNKCIQQNLEYKFFAKKGKLKSSPDHKYKIGFWCEWDIDSFKVYYVLFDKRNKEVKREVVLTKMPQYGEFIFYSDWKWLNNETILLEDKYKYGQEEKWMINLKSNQI